MFTGLIQALGTIRSLQHINSTSAIESNWQITCVDRGAEVILADLAIGDSVAVDGICLTVTQVLSQGFIAAASPETLRRTTLGQHNSEDRLVNLETSLRVGSKLGGHFVMGHVDGIGYLQSLEQTANSWEMTFTTDDTLARYIVSKGSIAINGVSLTIADHDSSFSWFKIAVIPLTYDETNLRYLQPGSLVNLEADILGKYVDKLLHLGSNSDHAPNRVSKDELTPAFLLEHGYL